MSAYLQGQIRLYLSISVAALALGMGAASSRAAPALTLQSMARNLNADPDNMSLQLALASLRLQTGAKDVLLWDVTSLFQRQISIGELNQALSLSFRVLVDQGNPAEVLSVFSKHQAHPVFNILSDEGLKALAQSFAALGKSQSAQDMHERLIEHFPISAESRWAMMTLQDNSCRGRQPRPLRLDLLRRLSRNAIIDPGVLEWLAAAIEFPVRWRRDSPVTLLQGVKKLEALQYLRLFPQVLSFSESLLNDRPGPADTAKILKLRGDALSSMGQHLEALSDYARAQEHRASRTPELMDSYASALAKTANFREAARVYEELFASSHNPTHRWQTFWNRYRAGEHDASLLTLESWTNSKSSRGELPHEVSQYWQGMVLRKIGREAEALQHWQKISQRGRQSTSLYASLTTPSPEFAGIESLAPPQELVKDIALWEMVRSLASEVGIDPYLVASVIRSESRFRPSAQSQVGARGLMQLMPYTAVRVAQRLGDDDFDLARLIDPVTNVRYGAKYLKILMNYYDNNVALAVAAYNAGPRAANIWLRVCAGCSLDEFIETISYRETRRYVREVLGTLSGWRGSKALPDNMPMPVNRLDDASIF